MRRLYTIDFVVTLVITIWGIVQNEVTVFYIVYLFWFQEFIRTVVDFVYLFLQQKRIREKLQFVQVAFGSFFVLFIYVVFILVLFGFMLNRDNGKLLGNNVLVLLFRNWFFNINLLFFSAEYIYLRANADNRNPEMVVFNRRHIILHISILLGAFIQLVIVPEYQFENRWESVLVISPFLLLKYFLDRPEQSMQPQNHVLRKIKTTISDLF
jgi:hypothetical protein